MASWEWNLDEDLVTGSALLNELFGLEAAASTFHGDFGLSMMLHPDDREAHKLLVEEAVARGGHWHTEYRVLRADGSIVWCEEVAEVTEDQKTRGTMIVGLLWDITHRKEAERFARSVLRDAMFPRAVYRQTWERLSAQ